VSENRDRRTMIVTGGSRGIGAAIALMAAARGYAVALNYLAETAAATRVVDAIADDGGHAIAVQGDVADEKDVVRLFEICDRELGPLDVLVNNAGITGGFSRLENLTAATLSRVVAVNIAGAFLCSREAVRRMSTQRGGRGGSIVNVSSRAAQLGGSGEWIHYAASKGALDTMTVGLAREVANEGIRVNAVAPGLIVTDLHANSGAPDRISRMAPTVPAQRAGAAEEVAECVLWLASTAASYVTGSVLPVAGGR
jgi:NAD(P)-dependent dehydrogenase (short-subunit alcohol dehydrogenase family)